MSQAAGSSISAEQDLLGHPAALVERYLREQLERAPLPRNLREALSYSLLAPGKRLRPALVVRACEAVGGTAEQAMPPAGAIELIHTFSLVHDDLPAMDDDDLRRGRPTLHKHTNEAMAILAGDAMMSLAFELLAGVADAKLSQELIRELGAGTTAMIAGQVYDTLPDFDAATPAARRLETIHNHKTGALIRASVRMGARVGGATAEQLANLTRYADAIGLMFQIVDDLLDVTQTTEQLGKTAGKDVKQDKLTYPAVHGLEASRAEVERLCGIARGALEPLGDRGRRLGDLIEYLAVRTR